MKTILLIFLSLLTIILSGCKSSDSHQKESLKTIFWHSSEKEELVLKSIRQWEDVGLKYKKGNPDYFKTVVIRFVSKQEMTKPDWLGEYDDHEIFINKDEKLSTTEMEHVIAHEFGHFLGLEHNKKKDSIMNTANSLNTQVSKQDILDARKKLKK